MNQDFFRSARVILAVALVMIAASSKLYAIDSNNRYFAYGVGQRTCDDYVKFREKRLDTLEQRHERYTKDELYEIVDRIVEHWIAGFLTAHNHYVSDTYDVAGKSNMDDGERAVTMAANIVSPAGNFNHCCPQIRTRSHKSQLHHQQLDRTIGKKAERSAPV